LNAIQALSQLSYSPTKMQRAQRVVPGKIPERGVERGAFYGTAVRCRNATAEAEVREAAVRFRRLFRGPGAAEAGVAGLGIDEVGGSPEAAGREAGAGRER
jgi:hypothetical protein